MYPCLSWTAFIVSPIDQARPPWRKRASHRCVSSTAATGGPIIFFEPRLLHRRFHGTSFEVLPTAPPGFARRRSFLEPAGRLRVTMALETMFPQAGAPSALLPQPRRPPSFSRLHGNNSRCMFCEIAFGRRRFLEQLPARRVGDGPMAPHHRPATPARCVSLIPYRAGLFATAVPARRRPASRMPMG